MYSLQDKKCTIYTKHEKSNLQLTVKRDTGSVTVWGSMNASGVKSFNLQQNMYLIYIFFYKADACVYYINNNLISKRYALFNQTENS